MECKSLYDNFIIEDFQEDGNLVDVFLGSIIEIIKNFAEWISKLSIGCFHIDEQKYYCIVFNGIIY